MSVSPIAYTRHRGRIPARCMALVQVAAAVKGALAEVAAVAVGSVAQEARVAPEDSEEAAAEKAASVAGLVRVLEGDMELSRRHS